MEDRFNRMEQQQKLVVKDIVKNEMQVVNDCMKLRMQMAERTLQNDLTPINQELTQLKHQINTLPPGCKFTVNTLYTYLLDSGNDLERERSSMAQHLYQGSASAPAERKVDPVYIALWLGRTATGAGNKNFSCEMYYSVDPGCTYKGFSNNDPLW